MTADVQVAVAQSLTEPSELPLARNFPSAEKTTALTQVLCPERVLISLPVLISQSLMVASRLPVANVLPLGEKATEVTTAR